MWTSVSEATAAVALGTWDRKWIDSARDDRVVLTSPGPAGLAGPLSSASGLWVMALGRREEEQHPDSDSPTRQTTSTSSDQTRYSEHVSQFWKPHANHSEAAQVAIEAFLL